MLTLCSFVTFSHRISAQSPTAIDVPLEQRRQQQRDQVERQRLERSPDVRPPTTGPVKAALLTINESPCFTISQIQLRGQDVQPFSWVVDSLSGIENDATLADKVGGIDISLSLGSSKTSSTSTTNATTNTGSTLAAGGNITIRSPANPELGSGPANPTGNILIQGATLSAGGAVTLNADTNLTITASKDTSSTTNSNTNSNASIGGSFGTSGVSLNAAASSGSGKGAGQDTSYTNTSITAGQTINLTSGANTTLAGATESAPQITATVGGNLTVESLQDTSTYNASSKSAGGSISLNLTTGAVGGSVTAGSTKVNSNFTSVNQQTGILAGDGGFTVTVAGNTTLTGGVISSTHKAVDLNLNSFTNGSKDANGALLAGTGNLTITDINNSASYNASGSSFSAGITLGPDGKGGSKASPTGSAGIGSASGNANSITVAGISGIAGTKTVLTGDAQTGLAPIFNAATVTADVNAQVVITAQFGSNAARAIGDYASAQMEEAARLRIRAGSLSAADPERQRLINAANAIEANWGDNGVLRIGAHTLVGALTGGVSGAAGTLAGTLSAPLLAEQLRQAGIAGPLADILIGLGSTAVGAAAGGTAGAAGALNEVANNYLTPRENLARNKAAASCAASNYTDSKSCGEANRLNTLDQRRDKDIQTAVAACQSSNDAATCIGADRMVNDLRIRGLQELGQLAVELSLSCAPPKDCSQAANWGSTELSTLYNANRQLWPYVSSGAVQQTAGPVEMLGAGALTLARVGVGAALGAGFDALGQYAVSSYQTGTGTVRIDQSLFAGLTGGIALPLTAGRGVLVGAMAGSGAAGINTTFNNWMYNEDTNIVYSSTVGAVFGGFGAGAGNWVTNRIAYTPVIPVTGNIPRIPAVPSIGAPYAPQIGSGAGNTVGGIPSFIPLDPNIPPKLGDKK